MRQSHLPERVTKILLQGQLDDFCLQETDFFLACVALL